MPSGAFQTLVPMRWRRRLRAGALAALYAACALLPWLHTLSLVSGPEPHGCCACDAHAHGEEAGPSAWSSEAPGDAHACWICDSLASLHLHSEPDEAAAALAASACPAPLIQAPEAPVLSPVNRACRSQAPPARA